VRERQEQVAMPLVEVDNLRKSFNGTTAVAGVSFSVHEGEVFGLLGPNGAGKTTTVRMLTTLLEPTSGTVRIAGVEAHRHRLLVRQLIGYVPQALSADAQLSGYENLLIIAKLLGMPKAERTQRIAEVLRIMDLEDAADRLVRTYSGGMVRRLEIGQAILHRPQLLFLDEPTVGLDPVARHTVWNALTTLRRETGLTLLVTTHYMEEAEEYCDRVAIMHQGQIAAIGTPAELKALIGKPDGTLEDVFVALTSASLESGGDFREVRQLRRRVQRFR